MGSLTDREQGAHMGSNRRPLEEQKAPVRHLGSCHEAGGPCLPSCCQQQSTWECNRSRPARSRDTSVSNRVCPGTPCTLTDSQHHQRVHDRCPCKHLCNLIRGTISACFNMKPSSGTPQIKNKHRNCDSKPQLFLHMSEPTKG